MIHRAVRLNVALPSPLQSILRDAAARAFTRTQIPMQSAPSVASQLAQASTSAPRTGIDADGCRAISREEESSSRTGTRAGKFVSSMAERETFVYAPQKDEEETIVHSASSQPPWLHTAGRHSIWIPNTDPLVANPTRTRSQELSTPSSLSPHMGVEYKADIYPHSNFDGSASHNKGQPGSSGSQTRAGPISGNALSTAPSSRLSPLSSSSPYEPLPEPPDDFCQLIDPARATEYARVNAIPLGNASSHGSGMPKVPRRTLFDNCRSRLQQTPPRNSHEFSLYLKRYKVSWPRPPLRSILELHDSSPLWQSTSTWNFVLASAIRHSAYAIASRILDDMETRGFRANVTTWQLHTRLLVRRGFWPEAVQQIARAQENWTDAPVALRRPGVPMAVWAELLAGIHPGQARRAKHARNKHDKGPDSRIRYNMLMRLRDDAGHGGPPARVALSIVQLFHRMGEHDTARNVAFALVPSYDAKMAIRIVNANLALRPRNGTLVFYESLKDLYKFVALCPRLRPSGRTLFAILGHLNRAANPGARAFAVARAFARRWGHQVYSSDVRRRLVDLNDGKSARRILHMLEALEVAKRRWTLRHWVLKERLFYGALKGQAYPFRGTRNWMWRKASKVGSREVNHPHPLEARGKRRRSRRPTRSTAEHPASIDNARSRRVDQSI